MENSVLSWQKDSAPVIEIEYFKFYKEKIFQVITLLARETIIVKIVKKYKNTDIKDLSCKLCNSFGI